MDCSGTSKNGSRSLTHLGRRAETVARHSEDGTWTTLAALRQLREELRGMDDRVSKLNVQSNSSIGLEERNSSLDDPLSTLDAGLVALREASRDRFESLEDHLDALEDNNATIKEQCSAIKERKTSEAPTDPPRAKCTKRRALFDTPESGECSGNEPECFPGKLIKEEQPRSTVPVRDTSSSKRARVANSGKPVTTKPKPADWFVTPEWARSVPLQSEPIPEAQDFAAVLRIFLLQVERKPSAQHSRQVPLIVRSETVGAMFKQSHSEFLARYGIHKWKQFLPIAQKYVAIHLLLPPLTRDLKRCHSELLLLENLERPYYSRAVCVPSWDEQMSYLCKEIGLQPHEWIQRATRAPLQRTPEPPARFQQMKCSVVLLPPKPAFPLPPKPLLKSHTPSALSIEVTGQAAQGLEAPLNRNHAASFPPLLGPIPLEWRAWLDKPLFQHTLIDILGSGKPKLSYLVRDSMRQRLGCTMLRDLLAICQGFKRLMGVAARVIKIDTAKHDPNLIILRDTQRPCYDDHYNREWIAATGRVAVPEPAPGQQSPQQSPQPTTAPSKWRSGKS